MYLKKGCVTYTVAQPFLFQLHSVRSSNICVKNEITLTDIKILIWELCCGKALFLYLHNHSENDQDIRDKGFKGIFNYHFQLTITISYQLLLSQHS